MPGIEERIIKDPDQENERKYPEHFFVFIINFINFLRYNVQAQRHGKISRQCSQGGSHHSNRRNQREVNRYVYNCPDCRDKRDINAFFFDKYSRGKDHVKPVEQITK